jgi:very-short-patch-repair endonuclease
LRIVLLQAGFTGLVSNLEITTRDGTEYRADFAFPLEKVIVEYQSEYHAEPAQFRRDMTRIAKLQADGWYVMQVNADDLRNPTELAGRIRHVLSGRPAGA